LCIHELTCDDELQEVVSAINSKSEQIQSHIDYLKKLIGYMQHEFSTPLAIAQLHIDRAGKKDADVLA
jgi:signal transduction histidine kinase